MLFLCYNRPIFIKNDSYSMQLLSLADLHAIADRSAFDFEKISRLADDDGLVGAGADLYPATLLNAYRHGVFPWFSDSDPIYWWCPPLRCVISPIDFKPAKSLVRTAKKTDWTLSTNIAFTEVIDACAKPRTYTDDTWIGDEIAKAYIRLHDMGVAMSIEVWENGVGSELIGGLYGVQFGAIFCGESMFHTRTDASKIAFWGLNTLAKSSKIELIDCQLENPHLMSLGASLMPRDDFLARLSTLNRIPSDPLDAQIKVKDLIGI